MTEKQSIRNKEIPTFTTFKYSENGKGNLWESAIVGNEPCFISYDHREKKIIAKICIEEANRILIPPKPSQIPYMPYQFESFEELNLIANHIIQAKISLNSLFLGTQVIIAKYNAQDPDILTCIASDVIWSYFQDKFSTTRYEMLIGGNGTGKSSLGITFGSIGYRPVNITDPTAASLYRIVGLIEAGQCCLILEEADKIDQNSTIVSLLKEGYKRDGMVSRVNPITLENDYFYSYCFKIVVAERSPAPNLARGILDRAFIHHCHKGVPSYDIKETLNPANVGGRGHFERRDELIKFRKLMIVYRLIHFNDFIPDIDVKIEGRDKELIKPTLQLFQDSECKTRLISAFQNIVRDKTQKRDTGLQSALLDTLIDLMTPEDKKTGLKSTNYELPKTGFEERAFKEFWARIPYNIAGEFDKNKHGEFHSDEYGTLYNSTVSRTLHDDFGIKSRHGKKGSIIIVDYKVLGDLVKSRLETDDKVSISINKKSDSEQEEEQDLGQSSNQLLDNGDSNQDNDSVELEKINENEREGDGVMVMLPLPEEGSNSAVKDNPSSFNNNNNKREKIVNEELRPPSYRDTVTITHSLTSDNDAINSSSNSKKSNSNHTEDIARIYAELDKITINPPSKCYYCDIGNFQNRDEYQKHVVIKHPGKLCYPGLVDIKLLKIKQQFMPWEI